MSIVLDLKQSYFQHAILILDDHFGDPMQISSLGSKSNLLQKLQVYVGDDPNDYLQNNLCPGGPYLDREDQSNWVNDPNNNFNDEVWKYGAEIWCNKEGRYTHIIADLTH